jgi:hypothetical protein
MDREVRAWYRVLGQEREAVIDARLPTLGSIDPSGGVRLAIDQSWKVLTVHWDIGLQGLGVLALYSLGFGLIAQLVMWRSTTHWLWLIAAGTFFIAGLLISEVWFGSATEEELQPNIDGPSRDEALLAFIPASVAVWITRAFGRRNMRHRRGHAGIA